MDLGKILAILGLSFLTSCVSVKNVEEIDKPFVHDKMISLKSDNERIYIGRDTDGDEWEDLTDCYEIVYTNPAENLIQLELDKIYKDEDNNHKIKNTEIVWKGGDSASKEVSKKRTAFFISYGKESGGVISLGYDTDRDSYEDSRGYYQLVDVDKLGHMILKKICSYDDKNKNHLFEDSEKNEIDVPYTKEI